MIIKSQTYWRDERSGVDSKDVGYVNSSIENYGNTRLPVTFIVSLSRSQALWWFNYFQRVLAEFDKAEDC